MANLNWRIVAIISIAGLVLSALGIIVVAVLYVVANNAHDMYSVVLDAGSSSTKLNLFKWRDEAFRTNAEVELVADSKVEPGISAYIDQPFNAYRTLAPALGDISTNITTRSKSNTPVYLAATAGMRLKLLEDPLGSLELFEVLRRGLLTSGFLVETPNERIRLLSGAEEGLFGWVSVNSALNLISAKHQAKPLETVGSLDLGGASTQISFVPGVKPPTEETGVDFFPLKLFGVDYNVYSHSFLCFGKNEFELRLMAAAIGTNTGNTINHPCFLTGYTLSNQNPDKIYGSRCVTGSYADKIFPTKLTKPAGLGTFSFTGTGNAAQCQQLINDQFKTGTCTTPPCSFNNVYQPAVRGPFRAYAGFSFVMAYLFKDKNTGFTIQEVTDAVTAFCARRWADVQAEPGSKFATKYCFDGFYVLALLNNYGFKTDDSFRQITFGTKINDKTVSWALGYMLEQSGHLPSELPNIYFPVALFVVLIVIFVILLILSIIGLAMACCRSEKVDLS